MVSGYQFPFELFANAQLSFDSYRKPQKVRTRQKKRLIITVTSHLRSLSWSLKTLLTNASEGHRRRHCKTDRNPSAFISPVSGSAYMWKYLSNPCYKRKT